MYIYGYTFNAAMSIFFKPRALHGRLGQKRNYRLTYNKSIYITYQIHEKRIAINKNVYIHIHIYAQIYMHVPIYVYIIYIYVHT